MHYCPSLSRFLLHEATGGIADFPELHAGLSNVMIKHRSCASKVFLARRAQKIQRKNFRNNYHAINTKKDMVSFIEIFRSELHEIVKEKSAKVDLVEAPKHKRSDLRLS